MAHRGGNRLNRADAVNPLPIDVRVATPRLILRVPTEADAPRIEECCSPREVARMLLRSPHPYPPGAALEFVRAVRGRWEKGEGITFVAERCEDGVIVACAGLEIAAEHHNAELGYWVAMECWGAGYATEAARAVVDIAFERLEMRRLHAGHYAHNPGSGRVLAKLGFRYEGLRPQHVRRLGEFVDLVLMGLLREDWEAMRGRGDGS